MKSGGNGRRADIQVLDGSVQTGSFSKIGMGFMCFEILLVRLTRGAMSGLVAVPCLALELLGRNIVVGKGGAAWSS